MSTVLIADDSGVVRRVVSRWLREALSDVELLEAPDGRAALELIAARHVDVVLLDVEMPRLDGLGVLHALRRRGGTLPTVLMFSTLTGPGTRAAVAALLAGAADVVEKPQSSNQRHVRAQLIERLSGLLTPAARQSTEQRSPASPRTALGASTTLPGWTPRRYGVAGAPARALRQPVVGVTRARPSPALCRGTPRGVERSPHRGDVELIVVASSTGGPDALLRFLTALGPIDVPIVCVQHMPPSFLPLLAARLSEQLGVDVALASEGEELLQGTVRLAQGGRHLEVVERSGTLVARYVDTPPENSCRPAADVLFRSAALLRTHAVAVVLTGMGADGARGAAAIAASGGIVLVQDQASSVVWGMPGAVVGLGVPVTLGAPEELGHRVRRLVPLRRF